jgi:thiol-disulfide isomerase/thioredoxin
VRSLATCSALLAFALVAAPSGSGPPAAQRSNTDTLNALTKAFASFDAHDMTGRRWTAEGLRGRVVVLDFWATWCAPCWTEIPWLRKIHAGQDPNRVQVIGVTLDVTDRRTLIAWFNRQRVDWPQIWERDGYASPLAERFGVQSLPTTLLVGPDGRVMATNLRGAKLVAAVETLLATRRNQQSSATADSPSAGYDRSY